MNDELRFQDVPMDEMDEWLEEFIRSRGWVERGDLNTWVWCGHCGAGAWGKPPHGEGEPCPLTVRRAEHEMKLRAEIAAADNAKTDAERMYYIRAAGASEQGMPSIADTIKRLLDERDES